MFHTKIKTILSLLLLLVTMVSAQTVPSPPQNILDFVQKQLDDYQTDCDVWAESLTNNAKVCLLMPCTRKKQKAIDACNLSVNNKIVTHFYDVLPASFPAPLSYDDGFTVTGKQTACTDVGGGIVVPICTTFSIVESLKSRPNAPFGVKAKSWSTYFKVEPVPGTCAGFPPVDCTV